MCGICGVLGKNLIDKEFKAFDTLFHISALRGPDSSGVFAVHKGEKDPTRYLAATAKSTLTSTEFLYEQELMFKKYREEKKPIVLVGHCRYATQGKITKANAHPFTFPNIVGVHNGTITSPFEGRDKFESDSEALYARINEVGIKKTIEGLRTYNAAYALVYFNKKEQTLNFLRNKERPLWIATTEIGSAFWASEKEFLDFTLNRYNITIKKIFELAEDNLLSYHLDAQLKEDKFTITKLKPINHYANHNYAKSNEIWSRGRFEKENHYQPWEGEDRKIERYNYETGKWEEVKVKEDGNVISLPPVPGVKKVIGAPVTMYKFNNEVMNAQNLDLIMKCGCSLCGSKGFSHTDFNEVQWLTKLKKHEFVCDNCINSSKEVAEMVNKDGAEYGTIIFRTKEESKGLNDYQFNDQLPKQMLH